MITSFRTIWFHQYISNTLTTFYFKWTRLEGIMSLVVSILCALLANFFTFSLEITFILRLTSKDILNSYGLITESSIHNPLKLNESYNWLNLMKNQEETIWNKITQCLPQTYKWKIDPKSSTSVLCLTTVRWRVNAIVVVHRKDATQKKCAL